MYKLQSLSNPGRVESTDETNLENDSLLANQLISQRSSWRGSTSSAFTHRPHRSEQVRPLLLGVRHSVAPSGATATRVTATPPSANTTAWPASWKQVARRSAQLKACMAQPYR